MARTKIPERIKHVVNDYVHTLKKERLPIEHVFLFGSYAKGTEHRWSDVDICVVSSKFRDPTDAIQYLLSKRTINLRYPIEPIGMSPADFAEDTTLTREIKRRGIEIMA